MSNRIPDGWQVLELANICYFQEGPGLRRWQYTDSGFPFINIRCIQDNRLDLSNVQYISADEANSKYKHFQLDAGDLVMSSSGTLGRMAVVRKSDLPIMLNTSVIRFRSTDEKRLSSSFLPQYLKSKDFLDQITEESQGSAQVNFGPTHLKLVVCTLPPIDEQQKIASILTAVDEVIESTTAQINKLKDLKTGMMQELLTKGIGHTEFKDSPVGWIPKAWECIQVSQADLNVIDGDRGSEYPKDSDYFQHEFCLFLSAKNVTKSGFQFDQCSFITRAKDEKLRKGKLQRGDIVITTRGSVGNIAFYDKSVPYDHVRINSGMAIIRNSGHKISSDFLDQLLHSRMLGEQIETLAFGSAQPQLTISVILGLWLPMPTLQEQQKIVNVMTGINSRERALSFKLTQTVSLKKSLMQELLTGAKRV